MKPLTADLVRKLAKDTLPALVFSTAERFYPVRAESWLTHTTTAPWDTEVDPDDIGALAADPHHRGTAIVSSGVDVDNHTRLAGPPSPDDAPLRLEASASADAIGNDAYAGPVADDELFLSFAGWKDLAAVHKTGDRDYLEAAFSELASAMNHTVAWKPIGTEANRPWFGHPQPVSPAVYCEVDWAGAHFREAPPADGIVATPLDDFIQLTYYFLFPARVALADQPEVAPLEGQWAAISVFYRAAGDLEQLDEDNRPVDAELGREEDPVWVVMSLDPENHICKPFRIKPPQVQTYPGPLGQKSAHVRAWVGAGTHRFFPESTLETPIGPQDMWPDLDYEPGSDLEGIFGSTYPAFNGVAAGSEGLGGVFTFMSGGLGLWLIAWLISLFTEYWDDDASEDDIPYLADSQTDPSDVTSGGPSDAAAPADPAQPVSDGFPTNDGSQFGDDVAYFDMKVISRLKSAKAPDLEPPPWWRYTGRWGVKVPPESEWASGTRRTDELGRSWAYWMAERLVTELAEDVPAPKAP